MKLIYCCLLLAVEAAVIKQPTPTCFRAQSIIQFTQYWIPEEGKQDVDNAGHILDLVGKPQFDLLSTTGKTLAKVNKETFTKCKMEGTCLVGGDLLNLSSSNNKFEVVNTKKYPYGIGAAGTPLMPFSSIAVNNLELGTTVFIKELEGYKLPNGNKHNGCVRVDDKGWSLNGCQIDLFVYTYDTDQSLHLPASVHAQAKACKVKDYKA